MHTHVCVHTYMCMHSFSDSFPLQVITNIECSSLAAQQVLVGYLFYISLVVVLVTKSCLTFSTPWTLSCLAPLSRQEYWNGLLFPSPGDLPDPGVKTESPALTGGLFTTKPPRKHIYLYFMYSVYVNPNLLIYLSPLKHSFKFLNELSLNKTWILQLFGLLLFSHWKQVACQTLIQGKGRRCAGLKRRKIGIEQCRMEMSDDFLVALNALLKYLVI